MKPRPAEFLTEFSALDVAEGRETKRLQLAQDFAVYSAVLQDVITAPEGFAFDGESIPAAVQWLAPPFGQSKRGACIHDYLYRHSGYYTTDDHFKTVTRKQADAVYLELVQLKGLPAWRSRLRYGVLRVVGWWAWNHQPA